MNMEAAVAALWRARFKLARPTASDADVERAIVDVMRSPDGSYASEIRTTADRRAHGHQYQAISSEI